MATVNILELSGIEGARRIDAEYYQPQYLKNRDVLIKISELFNLQQISAYITNGHTPRYADLSVGEVYFLTAEDVRDFHVNLDTAKRITKEDSHKVLARTVLKVNDLLITIKGKIGNAAIIHKLSGETNVNQDVARIVLRRRIDNYQINPYFVVAFINSKFGRLQVERISTGQINPFLGLSNLKQIKIPILDKKIQDEVGKTIKGALYFIDDCKLFYFQAENLLLEELGLKDFKPEYELSYTANLSKAFGVHRVDAEHFQPAYDGVVKKITKYSNGYTPLLAGVESVKPDFDPQKYPDRIFSYVELADIDASIGTIHSASKTKGEEAPSRARRVLKESDVIVSSVEGSLEKVALVDEEYEGVLASTGFFQFRPTKILPEVLLVLSKSIILHAQLKKECAGTILTAVPNESLRRIVIPILPLKIQQKIASLVQQSHEARRKAKELLEEAKRRVEKAIEKSK